jgi:hypothetical protein
MFLIESIKSFEMKKIVIVSLTFSIKIVKHTPVFLSGHLLVGGKIKPFTFKLSDVFFMIQYLRFFFHV